MKKISMLVVAIFGLFIFNAKASVTITDVTLDANLVVHVTVVADQQFILIKNYDVGYGWELLPTIYGATRGGLQTYEILDSSGYMGLPDKPIYTYRADPYLGPVVVNIYNDPSMFNAITFISAKGCILFKSTDGGLKWTKLTGHLSARENYFYDYSGTLTDLYKAVSSGQDANTADNWAIITSVTPDATALTATLTIDANSPYIIWYSYDAVSWVQLTKALRPRVDTYIDTEAFDPVQGWRLYKTELR